MSNTPSLLGCPFCGGMATAKPIDLVPGWHHVTVLHSDCFYKPAQDQMLLNDEHLAAWNRRTPQPVVREPLTTLTIAPVRRFLADRGIYLSDETTKALIVVAHGITQKGGD